MSKYPCKICDRQFEIYSSYYSHFRNHNPKPPHISCRLCEQKFRTTRDMESHFYRAHAEQLLETNTKPTTATPVKTEERVVEPKKVTLSSSFVTFYWKINCLCLSVYPKYQLVTTLFLCFRLYTLADWTHTKKGCLVGRRSQGRWNGDTMEMLRMGYMRFVRTLLPFEHLWSRRNCSQPM